MGTSGNFAFPAHSITGTRFLRGLKLTNEGRGKVETGLNIDE